MTVNKIDLVTEINNQTQMTLQVISTKKKETKKKYKKKKEEKKQVVLNLCRLFQKRNNRDK